MIPISDSIKSKGFPIFNVLLIALNVLVFLFEITSPNPDAFIRQYSLIPRLVNFSDINTLLPFVTAMFLHGGFLHIASNMLFLWVFGDNIEGYFGPIFFFALYLISGIVGNLLQYALMPGSLVPMLGASGAIAGVLGSYFLLFPHAKVKTLLPIMFFITFVDIPATFMLGYWFFLQIISGVTSLSVSADGGGTAFFAHIGGFATGLIITILLRPLLRLTQP